MPAPKWICALLLAPILSSAQPAAAQAPLVWFAPLPPGIWPDGHTGATDYMSLFTPAAPWAKASSRVQIFKIYNSSFQGGLPGSLSDSQWRQVFADLTRRNIALAVEWGPLNGQGCGAGIEGFEGGQAGGLARKIQALGGNLQYIAMDEPFYFGSLYSGPGACHWTAQQVAQSALQSIAQIRMVFPNVIVGDTEPVLDDSTPGWLNQYAAWIDSWRAQAGSPLAFFHCDVDWSERRIANVEGLRTALIARTIPFGLIYNGSWVNDTDTSWVHDAEAHFTDYELRGVTPDQVIFQTWHPHPTHVLPESDPSAFTYLINRYFRRRTNLLLSRGPGEAAGRLQDIQGNPIAFAPVTVGLQGGSGQDAIGTYTLTGTVPSSITTALVQICVNECGSRSTNEMNVYSFQYADSGEKTSVTVSGGGLSGWAVEPPPDRTASVEIVTDSTGTSLAIQATAAQQTYVNSPSFAVTPGSAFSLTVRARISADSSNSGYFALIFLKDQEISRLTIPFTATIPLGTAQTGSDGTYSLQFAQQATSALRLQVSYKGSDQLWPASNSVPLDDTPAIRVNGIVNAANWQPEPLSPGAWFTIFGQNFGAAAKWTNPVALSVGGASVDICGLPAVLSYNSGPVIADGSLRWQLNALVPDGIGSAVCPVVVRVNGRVSREVHVLITRGIMELFQFTSGGGLLPAITHADYTYVGMASAGLVPAKPGEVLTAWGTGDCSFPSVSVGGAPAAVSYSGRAAPGLCQINFVVPTSTAVNSVLKISTSPATYSLWVGR